MKNNKFTEAYYIGKGLTGKERVWSVLAECVDGPADVKGAQEFLKEFKRIHDNDLGAMDQMLDRIEQNKLVKTGKDIKAARAVLNEAQKQAAGPLPGALSKRYMAASLLKNIPSLNSIYSLLYLKKELGYSPYPTSMYQQLNEITGMAWWREMAQSLSQPNSILGLVKKTTTKTYLKVADLIDAQIEKVINTLPYKIPLDILPIVPSAPLEDLFEPEPESEKLIEGEEGIPHPDFVAEAVYLPFHQGIPIPSAPPASEIQLPEVKESVQEQEGVNFIAECHEGILEPVGEQQLEGNEEQPGLPAAEGEEQHENNEEPGLPNPQMPVQKQGEKEEKIFKQPMGITQEAPNKKAEPENKPAESDSFKKNMKQTILGGNQKRKKAKPLPEGHQNRVLLV